jgi:hypothetical protein
MGSTGEHHLRRGVLIERYPGLAHTHFEFTSPQDPSYNCLAFAANETRRCWHPSSFGGLYWPGGPAEDTLDAWVAAFEGLGYVVTDVVDLEPGFEKLAIYADRDFPLHVARQLPSGYWTSKLGPREDIEHELEGLVGTEYGRVVTILARRTIRPGPETDLTG